MLSDSELIPAVKGLCWFITTTHICLAVLFSIAGFAWALDHSGNALFSWALIFLFTAAVSFMLLRGVLLFEKMGISLNNPINKQNENI